MTPDGRVRRDRRLAALIAGLLERRQGALEQIRRGEVSCYYFLPQNIEEHYLQKYGARSKVDDHN
jgi:hypothetical protein